MARYLALLRGINVGGNGLLRMKDLKAALEASGFAEVTTYIQSGNVLVSSSSRSTATVAKNISAAIADHCGLAVEVVAFTHEGWTDIIQAAPKWWGADSGWRHYLYALLPPFDIDDVIAQLGQPVEGIEQTQAGVGVVYSSVDMSAYSLTTASKLASRPVYKRLTARNYNTSKRLLALLEKGQS